METSKPTPLRRRKSGDIRQLRAVLWGSLIELEAIILTADDPQLTIKASHALGTLSGSYVKCIELSDVVERIERLEAAQADRDPLPFKRRTS